MPITYFNSLEPRRNTYITLTKLNFSFFLAKNHRNAFFYSSNRILSLNIKWMNLGSSSTSNHFYYCQRNMMQGNFGSVHKWRNTSLEIFYPFLLLVAHFNKKADGVMSPFGRYPLPLSGWCHLWTDPFAKKWQLYTIVPSSLI